MGDELRRLEGEAEVLGRPIAPGLDRLERRGAIERAIDLGSRKPGGVPGEPVLLWQLLGIERAAPAVIGPTGCADQEPARRLASLPKVHAKQRPASTMVWAAAKRRPCLRKPQPSPTSAGSW